MGDFAYDRTVIAYHGCDQEVVRNVLIHGRSLKPSENHYDWLGRGIYFWEYGPRRALEWAKSRSSAAGRIKSPAVIGAILKLGRCFDLLDTEHTQLLEAFYPAFERVRLMVGEPLPVNRAPKSGDPEDLVLRELDCAVVNWTLDALEAQKGFVFDTVRGAFVEGTAAFPGSKIRQKSHIQLAVRNPASILGYFLPSHDSLVDDS